MTIAVSIVAAEARGFDDRGGGSALVGYLMPTLSVAKDGSEGFSVSCQLDNAAAGLMVETRAFLNGLDLIPRSTSSADAILLGLIRSR